MRRIWERGRWGSGSANLYAITDHGIAVLGGDAKKRHLRGWNPGRKAAPPLPSKQEDFEWLAMLETMGEATPYYLTVALRGKDNWAGRDRIKTALKGRLARLGHVRARYEPWETKTGRPKKRLLFSVTAAGRKWLEGQRLTGEG